MRTLQAILRIAVRLTTVGVIAPITRIVTTSEAPTTMVVVAALDAVVVAVTGLSGIDNR